VKLIICSRDIDSTLLKGDLISWLDDNVKLGTAEGLYNALFHDVYVNQNDYLNSVPFTVLNLPLITFEDIRPILEDVIILGVDGADGNIRKWKIDDSALEQRGISDYPINDVSLTKVKWSEVLPEPIRRDTLRAYREITRADIVITDILVAR